jgi:hypothetical protein
MRSRCADNCGRDTSRDTTVPCERPFGRSERRAPEHGGSYHGSRQKGLSSTICSPVLTHIAYRRRGSYEAQQVRTACGGFLRSPADTPSWSLGSSSRPFYCEYQHLAPGQCCWRRDGQPVRVWCVQGAHTRAKCPTFRVVEWSGPDAPSRWVSPRIGCC